MEENFPVFECGSAELSSDSENQLTSYSYVSSIHASQIVHWSYKIIIHLPYLVAAMNRLEQEFYVIP